MQNPTIETVDAQLKAAGLPTYTELIWRAHDVAEGIEDMKNLPGSVPARLERLKAALLMAFGQTKVKNSIGNPFALADADSVVAAAANESFAPVEYHLFFWGCSYPTIHAELGVTGPNLWFSNPETREACKKNISEIASLNGWRPMFSERDGTDTRPILKHFPNLSLSVSAQIHEGWVEYSIYKSRSSDPGYKPFEPDLLLSGSVKWDGCSNWSFHGGNFHACDRHQLDRIGTVLALCWDWTAEICPGWDEN